MILRVLLIFFICSSFYKVPGDEALIQWDATHRLTWDDFEAPPPKDAKNAALTSSSILMKFTTNGETLKYEISCNFDKKGSWGRIRNDHILSHEQGHFDIAEIAARKLNKSLKAYHLNESSINRDVNEIYKKEMSALWDMQTQYDEETDYSRDFVKQNTWLVKIQNGLKALEDYREYR